MIFFKCFDSLLQVPFCEDESVQLFRVAFFEGPFYKIHTLRDPKNDFIFNFNFDDKMKIFEQFEFRTN